MKYSEVQRLMLVGRWDRALVLLERISARYPDDADAQKLTQVCRTMLDIQSTEPPANKIPHLPVKTILKAGCRAFLLSLCNLLVKLPESRRKKLGYAKWRQWGERLSETDASGEENTLNHLFGDPRWRKIIFSTIVGLIALGVALIVWIAWPAPVEKVDYSNLHFYTVLQKAQNGDPQSQYQLGSIFYWGTPEIPADTEKSYYWLSLAAKAGHREASQLLAKVVFERENRQKILEQ